MTTEFEVAGIGDWGWNVNGNLIIAGPCSVESEHQVVKTALGVAKAGAHALRGGIWKPRTRPSGFEGIGPKGLKWLRTASRESGLPSIVETARAEHVEACLQAGVDAVWIGARTTVNPFQVQELADALGDTDIPVLLKNPINPDANLWIGALERLYNAGVRKLALVHRGFSLYGQSRYRNEPLWRIPIELKRRFPGLPMICDPSHICGNTELIPSVAQFALDLLFDGLMIESHINPTEALSDCKQQLTPVQLADLLQSLRFSSPSPAHQADREELERLFGQVQNTDKLLIDLLAQRTSLVKQVGRYKKERGIALLQLKDLDRVLESCLEYGAENGLAPEFLTAIWQIIHENSIENQALAGEAHE